MEIYMHNLNKITKILGATLVLVASNAAMAEDVTVDVKASVDNTILFSVAGELNFGVLRATASATLNECGILIVPADVNDPISLTPSLIAGSEANGLCGAGLNNAVIQNVNGGITRPVFTISGLADFTPLQVTVPARDATAGAQVIAMTQGGNPSGSSVINVVDFTIETTTASTPGAVIIDTTEGTGTLTADGNGDIVFTMGATLVTDTKASSLAYVNQPYETDFEVTVNYP
jgi:hypothetical protein